jgi:hypothetical protein
MTSPKFTLPTLTSLQSAADLVHSVIPPTPQNPLAAAPVSSWKHCSDHISGRFRMNPRSRNLHLNRARNQSHCSGNEIDFGKCVIGFAETVISFNEIEFSSDQSDISFGESEFSFDKSDIGLAKTVFGFGGNEISSDNPDISSGVTEFSYGESEIGFTKREIDFEKTEIILAKHKIDWLAAPTKKIISLNSTRQSSPKVSSFPIPLPRILDR